MAFFQSVQNRTVVLEFRDEWDVAGMRDHPDYIEVTKDGHPTGKKKSDQRPDYHMPFTRMSPGRKGK